MSDRNKVYRPVKQKRKAMLAIQSRQQIAELRNMGHSLSKISKLTGKSYKYVKQICGQEE